MIFMYMPPNRCLALININVHVKFHEDRIDSTLHSNIFLLYRRYSLGIAAGVLLFLGKFESRKSANDKI